MSRRRGSRARLLQALYQYQVSGRWPELSELRAHFSEPEAGEVDPELVGQVYAALRGRIAEVDELIEAASQNWRLDRMAAVDLSLIRLATAELLLRTAPARVVLNEAVDLAKVYGTQTSGGFVNGVLDGVMRQLRRSDG